MNDSTLGSQYALGVRYQHPITNAWIVRARRHARLAAGAEDVYGVRVEIRRKF